MSIENLPVAVIGAGPVGLAAAAHLLQRGERPIIFEAGDRVGHAIGQWAHVRMFSPWQFNIDSASRALLDAAGWQAPKASHFPTGAEVIRDYLEPLSKLPGIRDALVLGARVMSVGRRGFDKVRTAGRDAQPYLVTVVQEGHEPKVVEAKAVIDASGTFLSPNPAGSGGLPAIGEDDAAECLFYGMPDALGAARDRYAGRRVLVLGSGHSAMNALIDLWTLQQQEPATRIHWAVRRSDVSTAFGGGTADQLPARGELGQRARAMVESGDLQVHAPFRTLKINCLENGIRVSGDVNGRMTDIEVDEIVVATGFRPDLSFLREIRLALDPALECPSVLAPMIDPNVHSCGTVRPHGVAELRQPDKDFFIVGMKSYGRAPTFLLATGYEQVRSVVAALTGDLKAAARVELVLPETGVCSGRLVDDTADDEGCAVPVPAAASSCCGPAKAPVVVAAEATASASSTAACCGPAAALAEAERVTGEPQEACCTPKAQPGQPVTANACC